MPVTVYKSTDVSAPVLTGLAGSLITVLDAILVTGYGAKAAAGWSKAFTGTDLAVYRAATGARGYYRLDDSGSGTLASGKEAFLRGYETMTDVNTGTGPFPTATQLASGLFLRKSKSSDATARAWVCVADGLTAYFFAKTLDYPGYAAFMLGDIYSLGGAADAYRCAVIGRGIQEVAATPIANAGNENLEYLAGLTANNAGSFIARAVHGDGPQAAPFGKHGHGSHSSSALAGVATYPNPADGGVYLAQVWVHEAATNPVLRGRLRGFWHFLHPIGSPINDADTWSGTGALAGKTFMAIKPTPSGTGVFVMETSNTWETN